MSGRLSRFALKGRSLRAGCLLLGIVVLLSGCAFTYLPPIPASGPGSLTEPDALDVRNSPGLELMGGRLRLRMQLDDVPEAGWLAVQWFDPGNDEVASESVWLEAAEGTTLVTLGVTERITLTPGYWRALVSFNGRIVRQFAYRIED